MDSTVGRQHLAAANVEAAARDVGHTPARLLDQQRAAGDVPRLQPPLPVAVDPAPRDEAEVQ